jgi:hypothetical protein
VGEVIHYGFRLPDWCEPDDCPASICNGPHVSHTCPNGDVVTKRADDPTPCPFCGDAPAVKETSKHYSVQSARIRRLDTEGEPAGEWFDL